MSSITIAPVLQQDAAVPARERWIRRRVAATWGLLVVNCLTFYSATWSGLPLAIPIPSVVGKLIAQGALPAAMLMALSVNRRLLIRPNAYLCIVSLLVLAAFVALPEALHLGPIYRSFRLAGFVATLWMLTPWWGRKDLLLLKCHLGALSVVLGTVLLGLVVAPHTAYAQHRLEGAIWPYPPTQIAHFAAVLIGLLILLWLCGLIGGRLALAGVLVAGGILLMTHTRTALVAMAAGILIGGLSIFRARTRVRRAFGAVGVVISLAVLALSGFLTSWLERGESGQQLTSLTGRTDVWSQILSAPRDEFQVLFGFGLSNLSYNGLSIDSNWLGAYLDLGLAGVAICAAMLLYMLVRAYFEPIGPQRALALFLVAYCVISSVTETGLSDVSLYLLELSLAASLLVPTVSRRLS